MAEYDNTDRKAYMALGMMFGVAAGIGAGMLLAPRSGQETRNQLRERAHEAKDQFSSSTDTAKRKLNESIEKSKSMVNRASEKTKETADRVADRAHDAADKADAKVDSKTSNDHRTRS